MEEVERTDRKDREEEKKVKRVVREEKKEKEVVEDERVVGVPTAATLAVVTRQGLHVARTPAQRKIVLEFKAPLRSERSLII